MVANKGWEQEGLYLEGMWVVAWESKRTEGGEETDGTETEMGYIGWSIM